MIDTEMPTVSPGSILRFYAMQSDGNLKTYPVSSDMDSFYLKMSSTPVFDGETLTEWTISLNMSDTNMMSSDYAASEIVSVVVVFTFDVELNRFASNSVTAVAAFSQTFPVPVHKVYADGDLVLEQNEIVNFRGSFTETDFTIPDTFNLAELLTEQENLSTLFYVDWGEAYGEYGKWKEFTMDLRIRVNEVDIIHSIPLIESIENVIVLYLSTTLAAILILGTLQGFLFRNGYISTWPISMYTEKKFDATKPRDKDEMRRMN